MRRCGCESAPRASASDSASGPGRGRAEVVPHQCHPATPDAQWPTRLRSGTQATCDEYRPRSLEREVFGECLSSTTRTCSQESSFAQQDAIQYLAEQKFTETLIQEADLAESTLEQEEALFQKYMDDIAREMRKIMEDKRWLFVSEYLSQKAEQRKLSCDLRRNEVPEMHCSPPSNFFKDRPSKPGRSEDNTTHVRFMLDKSLDNGNSFGIQPPDYITRSRCNPCPETNFMYPEYVDRHYNNLHKLRYGNDVYHEPNRYSRKEHDIDLKMCCCEKYDCCICKLNCNRCSPKPDQDIGDSIFRGSFKNRFEDKYCREFSLDKLNFNRHHHSCANHGDYSCPRHGCRTCSPSSRPPRRCCDRCQCCCRQPGSKRVQSEKLTLDHVLGLVTVDGGCHSEAALSRGNRNCRLGSRRQGHSGRHRKDQTRSLHSPCQKAPPEAADKATAPCWESPNLKGAVASIFDKKIGMERHSDSRHLLAYQEENDPTLSDKTHLNDDSERHAKEISRVESRRYAPDEERRLLALIEARDALVQEAVEKGLSDQLASIDSLNKQIRAFVFSRPSSAPLEASHSHQAIPELSESTLANTTTVDNVAVDNSDSVQ